MPTVKYLVASMAVMLAASSARAQSWNFYDSGTSSVTIPFANGAMNRRVGLISLERVPVREGAKIADPHGHALGHVTSGTLGPTHNAALLLIRRVQLN